MLKYFVHKRVYLNVLMQQRENITSSSMPRLKQLHIESPNPEFATALDK